MKSTGIVRRVDELGRVVLPVELRRTLGIDIRDALEIFVDGGTIMLKKYVPGCVFCSNVDKLMDFQGQNVCNDCVNKLALSAENIAGVVNVSINQGDAKAIAKQVAGRLTRVLRMDGVSV
jgi:transcriptional pleiotropic regulator of transition state genes